MSNFVDMHAHYVSPALIDEVARNGKSYGSSIDYVADARPRLTFDGSTPFRPFLRELCDLDARREKLDADGIDLQVVSAWTDIAGDHLAPMEAARWARLQNETTAADVRARSDRYAAMGALPMQSAALAIAELDHIVKNLGMRAIELGTHVNGIDLDHDSYRPLWKRIRELDVLVLLHPPFKPVGLERAGDYFLNNVISFPADTTIAAARLLFSGIFQELPGLKICLAHAGGFLPYQIGRLDRGFAAHAACSRLLNQAPSELLGAFTYDTLTHSTAALSYLVQLVGAERVVYGSDYPFEMLDPAGPARVSELSIALTDTQRAGVLGENVRKLLFERETTL